MTPSMFDRLGIERAPPKPGSKVGLALGSSNKAPINGMRHSPAEDTNGWYIWGGDLSEAEDFVAPLHVEHMTDKIPFAVKYLDLPPGYRFQIDSNGYEDVWFDASLLDRP